MRPKQQQLTATGFASWVPVNYWGGFGGTTVSVNVSGTATYSIEYSTSPVQDEQEVTISRTTTTATVTFSEPHGMKVNDWITVTGIVDSNLAADGGYAIASVPSNTTLTYTVSDTGATSAKARAVVYNVFTHDELDSKTTSEVGGFVNPPSAIRLSCEAYTNGAVTADYIFLTQS